MSWRVRPTSTGGFEAFRREFERAWRSGSELTVLESVDSTNALARRTFEAEPVESLVSPSVVVAWEQTAGRGRGTHGWSSLPGRGLYASVLTPIHEFAGVEVLPLLLPVVVCAALRAAGLADCGLKWPNDLLTRGRKLGGFLVEAITIGNEPRAAILGLGVNYEAPAEPELATSAIGLADAVQPLPTLASVARRILEPLVDRLEQLDSLTARDLIAPYRSLTVHHLGERLTCRTGGGTVRGDFAGFDDHGFLRLVVGTDERLIGSGEIVGR